MWQMNSHGRYEFSFDAEKVCEVEPKDLVVYGIKVSSRYGRLSEIMALLRLAQWLRVEHAPLVPAVVSAFWDSKGGYVTVEMDQGRLPDGCGNKRFVGRFAKMAADVIGASHLLLRCGAWQAEASSEDLF